MLIRYYQPKIGKSLWKQPYKAVIINHLKQQKQNPLQKLLLAVEIAMGLAICGREVPGNAAPSQGDLAIPKDT